MPIKFRCAYCQKLLAVARRKSGSVVKCPKCTGEVMVPTVPGSAADRDDEDIEVDNLPSPAATKSDKEAVLKPAAKAKPADKPAKTPSAGKSSGAVVTTPPPINEGGRKGPPKIPEASTEDETEFAPVSPFAITKGMAFTLGGLTFLLVTVALVTGLMVGRLWAKVTNPVQATEGVHSEK